MQLRAIVIGAGWAGEGHTLALRSAGVEVVALCGRSSDPTRQAAARLSIPETRLDWRKAIADFHPDIVAIATPAAPHQEMAVAAAAKGCNVLCDKPLGLNAAEAAAMLEAVRRAGVKHAYAAASCLAPPITHARGLVADGLLGTLTGVESTHHLGWGRPLPHSWLDELALGGGTLNNLFTHKLAQVLRVTGGTPIHVSGEARNFKPRVPIGAEIHDFRHLFRPLSADESDPSRWREADADTSYSTIIELALPTGPAVTARFDGGVTSKSRTASTLTLYGLKGTLVLTGGNDMSPRELHHYDYHGDAWTELTVPTSETESDHPPDDLVQQDWNKLVKRFAADIRGHDHEFYPTFEDGSLASTIIGMVRERQGRAIVPAATGG
jgi:predicted dehydrogenase